MKISQGEWANIRHQFLEQTARRGVRLALRDRVWAVTPTGQWVALPGTSDSPIADKWWLGCDPEKLRERRPIGIILLCKARGGSLHAIGLPGALLRQLQEKLSKNERQVFFNVVRRGGRFLLQLREGEETDVTRHVNDLSWVANGQEAVVACDAINPSDPGESVSEAGANELPGDDASRRDAGEAPAVRFFAVVKNGTLHPLDEVHLETGSLYLVEARAAQAVPGNASLRRILARGGPDDLPSDFAERHDYYAHGAVRR